MQKSFLRLEAFHTDNPAKGYRAVFKTQHGRVLFLAIEINGTICTITDCFYLDRNQGKSGAARYTAKPQKLKSFQFPADHLLAVIEAELDKKFHGVEYVSGDLSRQSLDEYIAARTEHNQAKYRFLILLGEGETRNGLPMNLRTRLKTKLHRAVYLELAYYKDGMGVVRQCYYYDRKYKRTDAKITPPTLVSCFFPYTRKGILDLLNHEICCSFTHILITEGLDIESNTSPLCGAI